MTPCSFGSVAEDVMTMMMMIQIYLVALELMVHDVVLVGMSVVTVVGWVGDRVLLVMMMMTMTLEGLSLNWAMTSYLCRTGTLCMPKKDWEVLFI